MSRYRKIDTKIWTDEKFRQLTNDSKYFFVYLLTSPHSTAWGAYVLDDLYIQADLGYSPAKIKTCWEEIVKSNMVLRCNVTRLICFPNWFKYNLPTNQKSLMACIRGILDMPRSSILSRFCKESTWVSEQLANLNLTVSEKLEDEQDQEQEQEQEQEPPKAPQGASRNGPPPYVEIIDHLNKKTGQNYKPDIKKTQACIRARWHEGFRLDDFKCVVDIKASEWMGTEWEKFLRPETLFGTKFESYRNQKQCPDKPKEVKYKPGFDPRFGEVL